MRILVVGKYPPIQGGVSARTYSLARQLADRGHHVSVVTNAREVEPAYRIFMRPDDWMRCEDGAAGKLRVHWTAAFDASQRHIPSHNPFVTKLVSLGLQAARENGADIVFSFYLEPYAVAGHIIAQELGLPHVVKTAGSDIGRLWSHPQYKPFYDQILRRAAAVWTAPTARKALMTEYGVEAESIRVGDMFSAPEDLFRPEGDILDLASLVEAVRADKDWGDRAVFGTPRSDLRYFGMYGKIAGNKGTYDLIDAVERIAADAHVGLLLMGSASDKELARLRERLSRLAAKERVLHIPFMPHWRVPSFIRRCFAVCCLEQDFPIAMHAPAIAREVMMCGGCLVGSTEILRKMPQAERLVDGYNCVAIENVKDTLLLSHRLKEMVDEPDRADDVKNRTTEYIAAIRQSPNHVDVLEQMLARALDNHVTRPTERRKESAPPWLRMIRLVHDRVAAVSPSSPDAAPLPPADAKQWAREVLTQLRDEGVFRVDAAPYRDVLKICMILAGISSGRSMPTVEHFPQLVYRLRQEQWAIGDSELSAFAEFRPSTIGEISIEKFSVDANQVLAAIHAGRLPTSLDRVESYLVVQSKAGGLGPRVFVLDKMSAEVLIRHAVGSRRFDEAGEAFMSASDDREIAPALAGPIHALFKLGLIGLSSGSREIRGRESAAEIRIAESDA